MKKLSCIIMSVCLIMCFSFTSFADATRRASAPASLASQFDLNAPSRASAPAIPYGGNPLSRASADWTAYAQSQFISDGSYAYSYIEGFDEIWLVAAMNQSYDTKGNQAGFVEDINNNTGSAYALLEESTTIWDLARVTGAHTYNEPGYESIILQTARSR